jgi:hypothetical protein
VSGQDGAGLPAPHVRRAQLEAAVADLRVARSWLLGLSDPRETRTYLEAIRSCVTDIAEIAEDQPARTAADLTSGPGRDASASGVLAACGRAFGAVDQLLVGITAARQHTARARLAGSATERFAADRAVTRQLLSDRAAVDHWSHELLQAAAAYLTHAPAPVTEPGSQETTGRPAGDGTAGAPEPGETP